MPRERLFFTLLPDSDRNGKRFYQNPVQLVKQIRRKRESPIPLQQTRSAFIRSHNETLTVTAMRVGNPDRSPVAVHA
jgi:hypothetical protein